MIGDGWISLAVEGDTDAEVVRSMLQALGLPGPGSIFTVSKPEVTRRLAGYNQSAKRRPWYVQIDLDRDYDCAPGGAAAWLLEPSEWMCLSVVQTAVEAWILADRERCARWVGSTPGQIPRDPEELEDPKRTLLALVHRHGSAQRRAQMLPRSGSGRAVGREYTSELMRFVREHWRPEVARALAPTLDRALTRLDGLAIRWRDDLPV